MPIWWLSFADPHKPKGKTFLGATAVQAKTFRQAIDRAWELGINPGGEVQGGEMKPVLDASEEDVKRMMIEQGYFEVLTTDREKLGDKM